jgi:hypothetical protein
VGLSTQDNENIQRGMREAGAGTYFTKSEGTDRLLDYLISLSAKVAREFDPVVPPGELPIALQ